MFRANESSKTKATIWKNFEGVQKFCFKPIAVSVGFRRWFYDIWNWFFQADYYEANYGLIQFSFVSKPIISSPKYPRLFCKSISSKIRHTSSEIFRSICNAFAHLTASIVPLLIFCSNDKDGNWKSSSKIYLYDWIGVSCNNKLYALVIAQFPSTIWQIFSEFLIFCWLISRTFRRVK